ncbi:arylesterase [Fibrella sp. HMF5335]|uniref:Arylesterase n=1 Tax=Fibrella rubiginis TaxID=2817060 RepID=A0A939GDX6_9BACT|nr:arylesterase [Fibrella rubiginis]MBO0935459.1 arylesterase [Fibrella rubiginis]
MQRICLVVALASLALCLGCGTKTDTTKTDRAAADSITASSTAVSNKKKVIVFFGNSLAAGYGLDNTADAFPNRIGARLDSLGLPYRVVNAGLSGETTAGGRSRISWILRQPADIFVLELGGNDGLRGIPLKSSRENLQAIIDTVRLKNPATQIVIAGMQIPPNLGKAYTAEFRGIFKELATKNKAVLIPFLLENVGGIPKLNQPDGIHPNVQGHRIVTENVWRVIRPMVQQQ